jgi:Domain of unknown function (DUF1937)
MVSAPYSHSDSSIVASRMNQINESIAAIQGEYFCVTPLWNHYIIPYNDSIGSDWSFWKTYCEDLILRADGIIVLNNMYGWDNSTGVLAEIAFATSNNKQVLYFMDIK